MSSSSFTSVAPGRLCLFGEHQDYLDLPVMALALPLSCRIHVTPLMDSSMLELQFLSDEIGAQEWKCDLQQLRSADCFSTSPPSVPSRSRQPDCFCLAGVLEVLKAGYKLPRGAKCVSTTTLPIQKGCSSSSAFCVAWVQALIQLATLSSPEPNSALSPLQLAKLAHAVEVTHFGAPGGTMDHVTSCVGGLLRIGPGKWQTESLSWPSSSCSSVWILADSGQPKDTLRHLRRCKEDRLQLLAKLGGSWDTPSHAATTMMTQDEIILLKATLTNRDTERAAHEAWKNNHGIEWGKERWVP